MYVKVTSDDANVHIGRRDGRWWRHQSPSLTLSLGELALTNTNNCALSYGNTYWEESVGQGKSTYATGAVGTFLLSSVFLLLQVSVAQGIYFLLKTCEKFHVGDNILDSGNLKKKTRVEAVILLAHVCIYWLWLNIEYFCEMKLIRI